MPWPKDSAIIIPFIKKTKNFELLMKVLIIFQYTSKKYRDDAKIKYDSNKNYIFLDNKD